MCYTFRTAAVAELADAQDSKSCDRKVMRVRLPPAAHIEISPVLTPSSTRGEVFVFEYLQKYIYVVFSQRSTLKILAEGR